MRITVRWHLLRGLTCRVLLPYLGKASQTRVTRVRVGVLVDM